MALSYNSRPSGNDGQDAARRVVQGILTGDGSASKSPTDLGGILSGMWDNLTSPAPDLVASSIFANSFGSGTDGKTPFSGVPDAIVAQQKYQMTKQAAEDDARDQKKAALQQQSARKMLLNDPEALQLFDAGDTKGAVDLYMRNKGLGDPIKAQAGDVFLNPKTLQPIGGVPAAPPKPPEGYDYGSDGQSLVMIPDGPAAQKAKQDKFNNEQALNQQYSATDPLKTYQVVNNGYQKVRQASTLKTGAGDVSMIFAYMKMLDPSSVVREGEFATAQQTAGLPATVINLYNQAISGVRLNDQQRKDFLSAADQIYQSTAGNLSKQNKTYLYRAGEQGIDPQTFLVEPQAYDPIAPSAASPDYKQKYGLE